MPLSGGPSDKAGNRYEYLWTVRWMMRVMKGEADSIHLEPAGDEGKGIEFTVYNSSRPEHHQAKSQLTGERSLVPKRTGFPKGAIEFLSEAARPTFQLCGSPRLMLHILWMN